MPTAEVRALLPERPDLLVRLFPVFQRVEAIATSPAAGRELGEPHEQRRRMFIALRALLVALAKHPSRGHHDRRPAVGRRG